MSDKEFNLSFNDDEYEIDGINFDNYFEAKNALLSSMYEGFSPEHDHIFRLKEHENEVEK